MRFLQVNGKLELSQFIKQPAYLLFAKYPLYNKDVISSFYKRRIRIKTIIWQIANFLPKSIVPGNKILICACLCTPMCMLGIDSKTSGMLEKHSTMQL